MLVKLRALNGFCWSHGSVLSQRCLSIALLFVAVIFVFADLSAASQLAINRFHSSPAVFIANQGQWNDSVKFVHKGDGAEIAHTSNGIIFSMSRTTGNTDIFDNPGMNDVKAEAMTFSVGFIGAKAIEPTGYGESQTKFNFLIGKKENWKQGVCGYEKVAYKGLYDGIDLHTWGQRDSLKYEFHVAPGADYRQIVLNYKGIQGLSVADNGTLVVRLPGSWGKMVDDAPYIYQLIDGKKVEITGRFVLLDNSSYAFEITGEYDKSRELIIDPDVEWSSYLGGSYRDTCEAVAVDSSDNILLTGSTSSGDWSADGDEGIYGGWITNPNLGGAYIVKLSPSGTHIWSTYLAGGSYDIAVDSSDKILVTGITYHDSWGISGGEDTTYSGGNDAYIVQLTSVGGHSWSSYLGGDSHEHGHGIAIDSSDNVYVVGETRSDDWWDDSGMSGSEDDNYNGGLNDGFVVKFSSTGTLAWSRYFGGSGNEYGADIAVDSSDNIIITGQTTSSNWQDGNGMSGSEDSSYNTNNDGFIVKYDDDGYHIWSTYLGGAAADDGYAVAVDSSDNILVAGTTRSLSWDVPIADGWYTSLRGTYDAFVVKYTSGGVHDWSSYIGGGSIDKGLGVAVDSSGNVCIVGLTYPAANPVWISGGWDTSFNGGWYDGFAVKLDSTGGLVWGSYVGGDGVDDLGNDGVNDAVVDSSGNIILCGNTFADNWISGGWDDSFGANDNADGFMLKIDAVAPEVTQAPTINNGVSQRDTIKKISFTFTEDVDIDVNDLLIYDHDGTNWNQVTLTGVSFSYDSVTYTATWSGSPVIGTDGHYVMQLDDDSIEDQHGNKLHVNVSGGVEQHYRFHVLAGDLDGDTTQDVDDIDLLDDKWDASDINFDINNSGATDSGDMDLLVETIFATFYGDIDLNGTVGMDDFIYLKQHYAASGQWSDGDIDSDGDVDIDDFILLKQNYGDSNPSFALDSLGAVPSWP